MSQQNIISVITSDDLKKYKTFIKKANLIPEENNLLAAAKLGSLTILTYLCDELKIPIPIQAINIALANGRVDCFYYLLSKDQKPNLNLNDMFKFFRINLPPKEELSNFKDFFTKENRKLFEDFFNCKLKDDGEHSSSIIVIVTLMKCLKQTITDELYIEKILTSNISEDDFAYFINATKIKSITQELALEIIMSGINYYDERITKLSPVFTTSLTASVLNGAGDLDLGIRHGKDNPIFKHVEIYGIKREELLKIYNDVTFLYPLIKMDYDLWVHFLDVSIGGNSIENIIALSKYKKYVKEFNLPKNRDRLIELLLEALENYEEGDVLEIFYDMTASSIEESAPIHVIIKENSINYYNSIMDSIEDELPDLFQYLDFQVEGEGEGEGEEED